MLVKDGLLMPQQTNLNEKKRWNYHKPLLLLLIIFKKKTNFYGDLNFTKISKSAYKKHQTHEYACTFKQ